MTVSWLTREHRILDVDGQQISVTEQMAGIMDMLIERPGQIIHRDRMIQHLWPDDDEPDWADKILSVRVCHMRKAGIPIHTVWGLGYTLERPAAEWEAGQRYTDGKGPGHWRVEQVIREPVVVLYNDETGTREHVPLNSKRLDNLQRIEA